MTAEAPQRLGGRYMLGEPIGYGGMGRVFRAHDALLDRDVAVKVVEDAGAIAEARAAAGVSHAGVVRIFDVGPSFIVMELVDGRSLRDILLEQGRLPPARAGHLAAQIADALEAIHRHGLVHCDVKPRNILVSPSGIPKLIDFGVAQAAAGPQADAADGAVWASAAYVSPEQARGESIDARTDVYALGVVLYELLVGRQPFSGNSPASVAAQRLVVDPASPRRVDPSIPTALSGVVMRALARDPAHRFATAADLRDALRSSCDATSASTQRLPVARATPRVKRSAAVVALAALTTLTVLTGWRFAHSNSSPGNQPTSQPKMVADAGAPAPEPTRIPIAAPTAMPTATVSPLQPPALGPAPASHDQGKKKGRGRD
jgi:serine/threonine protein kinase